MKLNYIYSILIFLLIILFYIYIYNQKYYVFHENLENKNIQNLPSSNFSLYKYNLDKDKLNKLEKNKKKDKDTDSIFKYDKNVDDYYDPSIFSCIKNIDTPIFCSVIKGNYINIFPIKFCKNICPEMLKVEKKTNQVESIESFKNFMPKKQTNYYCIYGKKCVKKEKNPLNPSSNTCGVPSISQVPFTIYEDKDTCEKALNPCKKLSEEKCKLNYSCGWCTDSMDNGKCVMGTPTGPLSIKHNCIPQNGKKGNNYIQGMPKQFISQIDFADYFTNLN